MQQIWKYPIYVTDRQMLHVPVNAIPLCVQVQAGNICLWAQVEPGPLDETWDVCVVGTGQDMYNVDSVIVGYVGTVQVGDFVWHVFIQRAK